MNYSAISIGPIISTLGKARKPRELWTASYLFSHLMKHIYQVAEKKELNIISPAKPEKEILEVGIYPDRIYLKGNLDVKELLHEAMESFYRDFEANSLRPDLSYFNLMSVSCEVNSEPEAISQLNQKLDVLELCKYAADSNALQTIEKIVFDENFTLYKMATQKAFFSIPNIEEIASVQRKAHKEIKEKSHHRYFCVVQADGDNVGKTVSHFDLKEGEVKNISEKLVQFGLQSTKMIKAFGGVPIYAGGDDLLFIAPVIGIDGSHIFKLLDRIENEAFKDVHDLVSKFELKDEDKNKIEASLSFGLSITYFKYPLYEALEKARNLLFSKAKKDKKKKSVAWSLRKHSGGTFDADFSRRNEELWVKFKDLIDATTDNDVVSAVAHKIREMDELVRIVLSSNSSDRLDALFDKILEFDNGKSSYFDTVKALMPVLYDEVERKKKDLKEEIEKDGVDDKIIKEKVDEINFIQALYTLLRTAKFIKGEDLRDE